MNLNIHRNFISEDIVEVKINKHEMQCYRVFLNSFDMVFLYTVCQKDRLLWLINAVFTLDYVLVNKDEIDNFKTYCSDYGITLYTEKQLKLLNKK